MTQPSVEWYRSHNKCIDYFAYGNCGQYDVRADIAWLSDKHDLLNWDQCYMPQYQEHLKGQSSLAPFDHYPVNATLIIKDKETLPLPIMYYDLETLWWTRYIIWTLCLPNTQLQLQVSYAMSWTGLQVTNTHTFLAWNHALLHITEIY